MKHMLKIEIEDDDLKTINRVNKEILRILARHGVCRFKILSDKTLKDLES